MANGVHTPLILPIAVGGAADGGAAVPPPPTANNLLLAHPGPAGAANNLVASRQNQQRIANAAVAGVGGVIYINKNQCVALKTVTTSKHGINNAMLQATHMISQAIGRSHQPPATTVTVAPLPNAAAHLLLPGGDGNIIASLYTRLVSARAANRTDVVDRYERMIDRLEGKEEEELEACLLNHN